MKSIKIVDLTYDSILSIFSQYTQLIIEDMAGIEVLDLVKQHLKTYLDIRYSGDSSLRNEAYKWEKLSRIHEEVFGEKAKEKTLLDNIKVFQ